MNDLFLTEIGELTTNDGDIVLDAVVVVDDGIVSYAGPSADAPEHRGRPLIDCGNPPDYLRANLLASGGASVIGAGAVVEGRVEESVVWPGARVYAGERLVRSVRTPTCTVIARSARS